MRELERCCQVLGLEAGASKAEVKQAFRDLVHVWHPDRFSKNPRLQKKAEEMLKEINAAYEKLLASPQTATAAVRDKKPPPPPPADSPEGRDGGGSQTRPKQTPRTPRQAILALKREIRHHPENAEAHYNLGLLYLQLGRSREAMDTFKQAVSLKPRFAEAHLGLGVALSRLGNGLTAIASFRRALALKPDEPLAYLNLGITYRRLGRYRRGYQAILHAIRLEPDSPEAHYELGLSSLSLQNRASALEEYKILLKLNGKLAHKLFDQIYEIPSTRK